ncbi:hypothetical protein P7K49_030478, partial [Saguinus oedipus]
MCARPGGPALLCGASKAALGPQGANVGDAGTGHGGGENTSGRQGGSTRNLSRLGLPREPVAGAQERQPFPLESQLFCACNSMSDAWPSPDPPSKS